MTLTKRQWIMFTLFIIELSYVLFTSALVGSLLVISSSLSTLLFLGALYLEHNYNSKRMLLLAGVWLIVNMIFSMIQVFPVLISNFNTDRSEERRVGKECRSRWSTSVYKKN